MSLFLESADDQKMKAPKQYFSAVLFIIEEIICIGCKMTSIY